ncbi:MAG TPA: formyltetrahydrofolate deformylase [Cellvibrionaceae bacterium]
MTALHTGGLAQGSATATQLILKFSCNDQPGIVASVASLFSLQGFNIRESSQFEDVYTSRFFMRTVLESVEGPKNIAALRATFSAIADRYGMTWELHDGSYRPKLLIAVSQWGHCLNHLLNSAKQGSLPVDIVGVVSNHNDMRDLTQWYGVPYHYLPVTAENKIAQEAQILALMQNSGADFLALARYMQILSDDLCNALSGRAINIHHSFLPGFKGAKPYHQAFDRGVKLIGATAHYVTAALDEGPIIEQEVERVTHALTPEQLVEIGRDIEAVVLARAVRWHAEHRVILNGQKTVVFAR